MRKKEIKWVSRDKTDGKYDVWKIEPWRTEDDDYNCSETASIMFRDAAENERFDITLRRGGIAKIIIERQY